jgi:hypothetical protein
MGRRGYPPEFRRKVLDLVEAGTADRGGAGEAAHCGRIADPTRE